MDRDGGKRLRTVNLMETLKRYKYVLLVAALGVFLLLLPDGEERETGAAGISAAEDFDRLALQKEMERILSSLDGVGSLSLMLTVDGGGEYALAQDESSSSRHGGAESAEQTRKTETVVLGSGSGAGVVVTQSRYPEFIGALVVCEGGGSSAVRLAVTQAVSALTGLPSDRITVVRGKP